MERDEGGEGMRAGSEGGGRNGKPLRCPSRRGAAARPPRMPVPSIGSALHPSPTGRNSSSPTRLTPSLATDWTPSSPPLGRFLFSKF